MKIITLFITNILEVSSVNKILFGIYTSVNIVPENNSAAHWTEHPNKVQKHWDEYATHCATCFRNTHAFEIFVLVISRNYDKLAEKFVDVRGERDGSNMSHADKVKLLKSRLRTCSWGPRVHPQES
jgi:hypothetical protein